MGAHPAGRALRQPAGEAARGGMRVAPLPRRRSIPWVVLGVLLIAGCALAGLLLAVRAGQRQAVLAVAQPVAAGQVVQASDLRVARVASGTGLQLIPAAERAVVVGRPAAVPLVPGTLLAPSQLGEPVTLAPGEAVVALALKPGRFPPGLAAGARVLLAGTGTPGSPSPQGRQAPGVLAGEATVVEVAAADPTVGRDTVVTVKVPADGAARVAAAAAAEQVSVVLLPSRR